ncbi:hypothetical protein AMECASPLE_037556, partial [Ameca splendens]
PGHGGSRLSRDTQTSLSPDTSSSVFWAIPWASSQWDVPGSPPEGGVQEPSGGVTGRCSCSGCFLLSAITRSRSRNLEGGVSLLSLPACPSAVRSPHGDTKPLLTCPLSNTACSAEGLPLKDHKQTTSAL